MAQNGSIINALVAGTTDRNGRIIHNEDYRGGHFLIRTSTTAGATVTSVVTIEGLVPGTTGTFYTILASSALNPADASVTRMTVYPGVSTALTGFENDILPAYFRVKTTSATTGARTLSVDVNLVI